MDGTGDVGRRHTVLDRKRKLVNHFTGMRAHDAGADQLVILVGDDFDEAFVDIAHIGAADNSNRAQRFFDQEVTLDALFLAEAY